jgi:hypothetical protein
MHHRRHTDLRGVDSESIGRADNTSVTEIIGPIPKFEAAVRFDHSMSAVVIGHDHIS